MTWSQKKEMRPVRHSQVSNATRIIAHLDMDAFFAAIEQRDNPHFRDLAVVVGADPREGHGRGVVSTADYMARKFGIRSAMPISEAWRRAQKAERISGIKTVFLPVEYWRYQRVSEGIMQILKSFVPQVEQSSIDEAYLDLSFIGSFRRAELFCRRLKKEIYKKERLTCSIGVGSNKLIAKITCDQQKPDGLKVVESQEAAAFLAPLSIRVIPGIGPKTEIALKKSGAHLVADLQKMSLASLEEKFGRLGIDIYYKARGKDNNPLDVSYNVKSLGEQETFLNDTLSGSFLLERLRDLCAKVHARFSASNFSAYRTITLTVRFADFTTTTKTKTFVRPTYFLRDFELESIKLFLPFLDRRANPRLKKVRLLAVRLEKLS